ncbi:MauE/DoxX family redox-associated membrane protein [Pseudoroseicyclus sp. H15]
MKDASNQTATIYRMVMPDHLCPYGLKSVDLLEREGFEVDDHWLTTREETDAFLAKHNVETSPQTWIGGKRIGGYGDLRNYFDKPVQHEGETSYQPVIAIFAVMALAALALTWGLLETVFTMRTVEWFVALSMCVLAIRKLEDLESFSTMFLNYDLLARRWVPYGKVYPFGEALAGILMVGGILPWISGPVALFIGTIGAISVFKAVYIDRRALKCACVGGASSVPLGFISLTENLAMVGMGLRSLLKLFA